MKKGKKSFSVFLCVYCLLLLGLGNGVQAAIPKEKWKRFYGAIVNVKSDPALAKGQIFKAETSKKKRGKWEDVIFVANEHTKGYYDTNKKDKSAYIIQPTGRDVKIDTVSFNKLFTLVSATDQSLDKEFKNQISYQLPQGRWQKITDLIKKVNSLPNQEETDSTLVPAGADSTVRDTVGKTGQKTVVRPYTAKVDEDFFNNKIYWYGLICLATLFFACFIYFFRKYKVLARQRARIISLSRNHSLFFEQNLQFKFMMQQPKQFEAYLGALFERLKEFVEKENEKRNALKDELHLKESQLIKQISDQEKIRWHQPAMLSQIDLLFKDSTELYTQLLSYAGGLAEQKKELEKTTSEHSGPSQIKTQGKTLFFKEPSIEGYFDHSRRMLDSSNQVLFRFDLIGVDKARFSFQAVDPQTVSQALSYSKYKIEPVCEIQGVHSENAARVVHLQDGAAQLNSQEQWVVTQKAVVLFE